jgi:hypothetical protein
MPTSAATSHQSAKRINQCHAWFLDAEFLTYIHFPNLAKELLLSAKMMKISTISLTPTDAMENKNRNER